MSAVPSIAPAQSDASVAQDAADLYARHSRRVFGYCLGLLRDREEAEDAVQTTFLNAYRGLQRGVRPQYEVAWLFKIAQNVCRTRREAAWRRGRVEAARDLDVLEDVVAAPEHDPGWADAFADALKRMPERYRRVIVLREWHGMSYREIASELGLSEGAVEMLVFRARRSLAEELERVDAPRGRALSLSAVAGFLKSLLGGGAAKTAVMAAVVVAAGTAVVVSTGELRQRRAHAPAHPVAPVSAHDPVFATNNSRPRTPARHTPARERGAPAAGRLSGSDHRGAAQGAEQAPVAPVGRSAGPVGDRNAPPAQSGARAPRPPAGPAATTPSVTVPGVTVPGTSVTTPTVTVPSVDVPAPPPVGVTVPDLPMPPLNPPKLP